MSALILQCRRADDELMFVLVLRRVCWRLWHFGSVQIGWIARIFSIIRFLHSPCKQLFSMTQPDALSSDLFGQPTVHLFICFGFLVSFFGGIHDVKTPVAISEPSPKSPIKTLSVSAVNHTGPVKSHRPPTTALLGTPL